jgi:hypothetical protein
MALTEKVIMENGINSELIINARAGFKNGIKSSFKNIWLSFSVITWFGYYIDKFLNGEKFESIFFEIFVSLLFPILGFAIASSTVFPGICIATLQYFILKQKIIDNEHLKTSNFVTVKHHKSFLLKIGTFFFGIKKVIILEINGKKPSQEISAICLFNLKHNQMKGSMIRLPIGCYYIPRTDPQISSKPLK